MLQTENDEYSECGLADAENSMVEFIPYGSDDDPFQEEEEITTQTVHSSIDLEKSNGIPNDVEKRFRIDAIKCELVSIV